MARTFDIPPVYQSSLISQLKEARRKQDPLKRDLSPSTLDFGPVQFKLARHFGFCYGVENAVEIAYRALEENEGKRIYLLSEMIHNPHVNDDLRSRGIDFLRTTSGKQLISFDSLTGDDIVIIPAFGTSIEIKSELEAIGLDIRSYDTTCPFVEKVWKRSAQIGTKNYTVVIHGKYTHEETRATYSHAAANSPTVVIRNMDEAERLAMAITGHLSRDQFFDEFGNRCTPGFDPESDLARIGVVNQTTMLASETKAISEVLRQSMITRYGEEEISTHFADTSDTLCYATNENQDAVHALVQEEGHVAVVVGGINSSNTSHLVELCEEVLPTYFVSRADQISGQSNIEHFDLRTKTLTSTSDWLPRVGKISVLLAAGASCPDVLMEEVMFKILSSYPGARSADDVLADFAHQAV